MMVKVARGLPRRSPRLSQLKSSSINTAVSSEDTTKFKPAAAKRSSKRSKQDTAVLGKGEKQTPPKKQTAKSKWKNGTLSNAYEKRIYGKGYKFVVGTDEAGRGPLAGPVVAACCYVPMDVSIEGIFDSKALNESQREELFEKITTNDKIKFAIHVNSAQRIDEINILQASLEAMAKSVIKMPVTADFVFVDGNKTPKMDVDSETVVKGDSKVLSIAAASILAKVTRDRLMVEYHAKWPEYEFERHKGYPTKGHMAAVSKYGPCPIHRMTFAPLKHMKH